MNYAISCWIVIRSCQKMIILFIWLPRKRLRLFVKRNMNEFLDIADS